MFAARSGCAMSTPPSMTATVHAGVADGPGDPCLSRAGAERVARRGGVPEHAPELAAEVARIVGGLGRPDVVVGFHGAHARLLGEGLESGLDRLAGRQLHDHGVGRQRGDPAHLRRVDRGRDTGPPGRAGAALEADDDDVVHAPAVRVPARPVRGRPHRWPGHGHEGDAGSQEERDEAAPSRDPHVAVRACAGRRGDLWQGGARPNGLSASTWVNLAPHPRNHRHRACDRGARTRHRVRFGLAHPRISPRQHLMCRRGRTQPDPRSRIVAGHRRASA